MHSTEMWILAVRLDIGIPGARSLKDRRQVVRSLKERLISRLGVQCAEVGELESWVRASLGVTACSNDREYLEQLAGEIIHYAQNDAGALVGHTAHELWRFEGA